MKKILVGIVLAVVPGSFIIGAVVLAARYIYKHYYKKGGK